MSFLLKNTIHRALAESLLNEVLGQRANYYYFIGRILNWSDESTPETPEDTDAYEYDTRNSIISVKRIGVSDVSLVVPRIDWVSSTVYDQFDGNYTSDNTSATGATSLKASNFYVLTNNFGVYKCLDNNNGAASTEQPSGTDPIPVEYNDGYIWKYLYTIPLSLRNKFLTDAYMPVQKQVTNKFYSSGQISDIIVDNRGSGYTNNTSVQLTVYGTFNGGEGNAIANLTPVINDAGQFIDVRIIDRGNNYASANIAIVDNTHAATGYYNTSATANMYPIIYNGQIDRVLIDDPGIGYSSNLNTVITYFGDGANALLTPYVNSNGEVEDIIIENPGDGYTYLDIEVVGDGANANAFVTFFPGDLSTAQSTVELASINGSLETFIINNVGNNYTHANISVSGDGAGFAGSVVIDNNTNTITSITVTDRGAGYSYANVTITGDGSNASATAIISPYNGHGFDAVKELFADTIMFYTTINNEKNQGIEVNNDYRQFGIIKDISQFNSKNVFTGAIGSNCYLVTLDSTTGIERDTVLTLLSDSTRTFEVVEVYQDQVLITDTTNQGITPSTELYSSVLNSTFTVSSVDELPDINKYSGDLIFIDNRTSVSYSDQQLVTLRTTIRL